MWSKNRIAKYLLPIILKDRKEWQWYVEPFVWGANMIDKVEWNRIGADFNEYLIRALMLIRDVPEIIPDIITEDYYKKLQDRKNNWEVNGIIWFVWFAMSFGWKFFWWYRRDVAWTKWCIENMKTQTRRCQNNAIKQSEKLQRVKLIHSSYQDLEIPKESIIYCDIPYKDTTKYKTGWFDYEHFYNWCREKKEEWHTIFISEYNMPDDFECVWEQEIINNLNNKKATEKLFTL